MSTKNLPSLEYVRQCFRYEDGQLSWRERPREHFTSDRAWKSCNSKWAGKKAGCPVAYKARYFRYQVMINGQLFYKARVVWFFHTGEWPEEVDHKNRDTLDDRIENLRPATKSQNQANANIRKDNMSGYRGVSWDVGTQKWVAQIQVNHCHMVLGRFDDPVKAHAAYVEAARKHFGEFHYLNSNAR